MADQDVMKEFLVSLGFKVDKQGMKSFTDGVDGATRGVKNLVTAITGASLVVAAGVSAFASNLEGLYFASQRVGASATSIKSAEYAARDLGASAAEARGSLESMARFLRENPGGESFLKGIGVQTRDANGELRDTADLMVGLGDRLRNMPWYQAKQYAGILGIDDNTLRAIISGEFSRKLEENRKRLAGSGLDQATKDAHVFMEQLRGIGLQFETLSIRVQAALMHRLGPELEKFSAWFEKNGPMIADRIVDVTEKVIQFGQDSEPYLKAIYQFFVDLDRATDGWSTKIIVLLGLMRALGMTSVVSGVLNLAAAFLKLGTGIGAAASAAAAPALTSLLGVTATGVGAMLYSSSLNEGEDDAVRARRNAEDDAAGDLRGGSDMAARVSRFFEALGWSSDQAAGIAANLSAESSFDPNAVGDGGKAYGVAQWHPDRQEEFRKWAGKDIRQSTLEDQLRFVHHELTQGNKKKAGDLLRLAESSGQAGGIVSRYYERPADKEGEAAKRAAAAERIAANAQRPISIVMNAEEQADFDHERMAAETEDRIAASAQNPISIVMSADEQADFDGERIAAEAQDRVEMLIRAAENLGSAQTVVPRYYERPALAEAGSSRGSGAAQMSQSNTINVYGATDPNATASAVSGAQKQVNQDLMRNLNSPVN